MLRFFTNQRIVGVAFMVIAGLYIWFIRDIPLDFWSESEAFNARTMPTIYGYAGLIVATLLIVTPSARFDWSKLTQLRYAPAISMLSLLVLYGFSIDYLGFLTATVCLLVAGFLLLGERRYLAIGLVALGLSFGFYFGLDLLDIYLSPGELWS